MKKRLPLIVAILIVALVVSGCPTPGPVVPQPDADAAPQGDDGGDPLVIDSGADASPVPTPDAAALDDCARAEATIVRLACKSSLGQSLAVNKHGVPFAMTCRQAAAANPPLDLHPACIARATTCKAVFACGV